jgi:hypothetical protein
MGPSLVRNGDFISFEFDHSIKSFTVQGMPGDLETHSWLAQDLAPGAQTLRIEWQNRGGADPASGCHEVQILVEP